MSKVPRELREAQEPVATVTIQHYRQDPSMENLEFQLLAPLPQGTHKLYAAPVTRAEGGDAGAAYQREQDKKLVEALEQITRMTYDVWTNGAIACRIADEALTTYRAAQEKK